MNTYIKQFLLISVLLCSILFCGCQKDERQKTKNEIEFLQKENFGLYGKNEVFTYNPQTCQYSVNRNRHTCRFQSDNGEYLTHIRFETLPKALDDIVDANITYIKPSIKKSYNLNLKIIEHKNNKMWLWDYQQQIGIIIPYMID